MCHAFTPAVIVFVSYNHHIFYQILYAPSIISLELNITHRSPLLYINMEGTPYAHIQGW